MKSIVLFSLAFFFLAPGYAQESYSHIILGGGPAGLSAAIELATAGGEKILVLEKRVPSNLEKVLRNNNIKVVENSGDRHKSWGSRDRNVAIDERALNRLRELGVNFKYFPIRGIHFKNGNSGKSGYISLKSFGGRLFRKLVNRDFAASVSISDIEKDLSGFTWPTWKESAYEFLNVILQTS